MVYQKEWVIQQTCAPWSYIRISWLNDWNSTLRLRFDFTWTEVPKDGKKISRGWRWMVKARVSTQGEKRQDLEYLYHSRRLQILDEVPRKKEENQKITNPRWDEKSQKGKQKWTGNSNAISTGKCWKKKRLKYLISEENNKKSYWSDK